MSAHNIISEEIYSYWWIKKENAKNELKRSHKMKESWITMAIYYYLGKSD